MSDGFGLILPSLVSRIPWVTGRYYDGTHSFGGSTTTAALGANILYADPVIPVSLSRIPLSSVPVDRIGIEVTTGSAGKKARLGIYAMGADGKPGALIVDAGEIDVASIAGVEATIATTLQCGVPVFRAIVSDGTPTLRIENSNGFQSGATSLTDTTGHIGWQAVVVYTAGSTTLPDPFPTPSISNGTYRVMLRAA